MQKINFEDGQLVKKGYVEINGTQYPTEEAEYNGTTPLSSYVLNKMQDNIEEAINNVQALPAGGTTGQVLTKKSETDGDVEWSTVEGNEVYIGNEADAPETAKIVIDEDETSWEDEGEIYSTTERRIGTWIDGKPLYRKVVIGNLANGNTLISNVDRILKLHGNCKFSEDTWLRSIPFADTSSSIVNAQKNPNTNDLIIAIVVGGKSSSIIDAQIILEYTKTTD